MTGPHLSIDSSGLRQIQERVQVISQPQVSIHARHCWRANPFACNTLPSNGFFLCLREPSDAVLCLHEKPPPDHQKPN